MPERIVVIGSPTGLHARPAGLFSKAVAASGKTVTVRTTAGKTANGRSILALISLGAVGGESVTLESSDADGSLFDQLEQILSSAE